MRALFSRLLVLPVAGGLILATGGVPAAASAPRAAAPPPTVPAVRQWHAGGGSYAFTASSRVVVDSRYAGQLNGDGTTLAGDLSAAKGRTVAVAKASAPRTGDVFLTLGGSDADPEGYTATVGGAVTVRARTEGGVFNGTRTVLQWLHQSASLPGGTATDAPLKRERGLMVDLGRKYFTLGWLRAYVKELSYLKMNTFHLHLSDTFGFRLESSTHPEIVSPQHYSKKDITDLIALGRQYHVTIIPEIDMPGHLDAVLAKHPELKLTDSAGNASASFIDLSKDGSYTLMKDLITEYMPLFPTTYWHLGADEYVTNYAAYPQLLTYARAHYGANATAKDTYYGFVNWADSIVRGAGKTMRMWNDGIKPGDGTIAPKADIVVEYWYNYGLTPQQLLDAGHTVANESWDPTYYVLGGTGPNNTWVYETWKPDVFQGNNTINAPARNLGSNLHVWCDHPDAQTEQQVAKGIRETLRVLSQQTWGSPKPVPSYAGYVSIINAVGDTPGFPYPAS